MPLHRRAPLDDLMAPLTLNEATFSH